MTQLQHPTGEPMFRVLLWRLIGQFLFRYTVHNWYAYRRLVLRVFGMKLSSTANFRRTISLDRPWNIEVGDLAMFGDHVVFRARSPILIGDRAVVSQLTILTTECRDLEQTGHPTITAPITIMDDCWIATDTLVMPGIVISAGTVVGARSFVDRDLPAWQVAAGNPAIPRRPRTFVNTIADANTMKDTIQREAEPE